MPTRCNSKKTDRYISFQGIDCDGNARRLMACIEHQLAQPGRGNAFWDYFRQKRKSGPQADDLFLVHAHLNAIRELFETWDDREALALLDQIEEECC